MVSHDTRELRRKCSASDRRAGKRKNTYSGGPVPRRLLSEVRGRNLKATSAGTSHLALQAGGLLCDRVELAMTNLGIAFNKGSVAKRLRSALSKMSGLNELPPETKGRAEKLMKSIVWRFPETLGYSPGARGCHKSGSTDARGGLARPTSEDSSVFHRFRQ